MEKNGVLNMEKNSIIGAIIGDIAGSRFEFNSIKSKEFDLLLKAEHCPESCYEYRLTCHFTADTVMTIAVANALIESNGNWETLKNATIKNLKYYGQKYPHAGYGSRFKKWLNSNTSEPYNSFGNGSAMRISSVPYFAKSLEEVKILSSLVTEVTHNHPEGVKGAEAVAVCIWLAMNGYDKNYIKNYVEENYYKLNFDYDDLLKNYTFSESCQGSVPQSIFAFIISNSYEDTLRTAISMGGDSDTMACIAGSIAGVYYGIPKKIYDQALEFLPPDFINVIKKVNNNKNN